MNPQYVNCKVYFCPDFGRIYGTAAIGLAHLVLFAAVIAGVSFALAAALMFAAGKRQRVIRGSRP